MQIKNEPSTLIGFILKIFRSMKILEQVEEARQWLKEGKIIAYPTESVYGLGCDPFNQSAVEQLLALKHRDANKGLIVLISDFWQLTPLIQNVSEEQLVPVKKSWPGPVTWVFPKSSLVPTWISGLHETVAIRMSAHDKARQLCTEMPIISTSANVSGHTPAMDLESLKSQFPRGVDAFLQGSPGGNQPTVIYDLLSGCRMR